MFKLKEIGRERGKIEREGEGQRGIEIEREGERFVLSFLFIDLYSFVLFTMRERERG